MRLGNSFFFISALILYVYVKNTQSITSDILDGPSTQYALIGENATFTCKTTGREAFWVLNRIPMTITYSEQKQVYKNKGVMFLEDHTQEYHNLTMIIHASLDLNNTVIVCSVIGSDWTVTMSEEVHLIVFNILSPYSPAVSINISYVEHPSIIAKVAERPRWPGYDIKQFRMNVTNAKDSTLLGRYYASAGNGMVEIRAPLPDSVINQCVELKIAASAVSEQYGEGQTTEVYVELYKSPGFFSDEGVRYSILPHANDSSFHISLTVKLPDVCKNQQVNYSFVIESDKPSEVVERRGPFTHYGPGNVSHCIDSLDKNNSYSVMVQVESIAGNRESERMYLNTSNIRSCLAEDTTDQNTPTTVQPLQRQSMMPLTTEVPISGTLSQEFVLLVIILVVMLVILLGVSGVFMWFCHKHNQIMKKFHNTYKCSATVMVPNHVYLERLHDKIRQHSQIAIPPMSPSPSGTQNINSSPPVGNPTPLSSTHYKHHHKEFICKGKVITPGQTVEIHPHELDERYVTLSLS